jgi:Chaperone of endosialidase
MTLAVKDRVRETSTTAGTGTLTLAGAVSGFQAFSVIGNANTTYYGIVDSTTGDFEVGIGTYTLSGTTLSRTTVLSSSNAGSLVNFAANSKDVFVTYPSSKSVYYDASSNLPVTGALNVTSASATSLAVGLTGATNPAFTVDSSTASQVAGLKVTGAATGGTVVVVATDSGSNTSLTVNAKGTGTIGIGSVSTGVVTITPATTHVGIVTVPDGTAALPSIISTTGTADTGQFFPAADTIAYSTAGTERMRIGSTGLVGIATTSSTYGLSVNSSTGINSYDGVAGKGRFVLGDPADSTGYVGMYRSTAATIGTAGNSLTLGSFSDMAFTTGASAFASQTERMRIATAGNVLIGTTTQVDGAKLSLFGGGLGGLGFATSQNATTVSTAIDSLSGFTTRKDSADFWHFGRSGSANCVSSGGSWVNSSDERLKENIVTLPDALNKVCSLRGVSFNRISSGQPEIGLIAQEVQQIYPDVVEVGDYLGLNYGALVGALVEAIKELKTITEAQAARITALETA